MPKKQLKDVDDHHCGDDQIYWGSINVRANARALKCSWTWRDQGWGNRKGRFTVFF